MRVMHLLDALCIIYPDPDPEHIKWKSMEKMKNLLGNEKCIDRHGLNILYAY